MKQIEFTDEELLDLLLGIGAGINYTYYMAFNLPISEINSEHSVRLRKELMNKLLNLQNKINQAIIDETT